MVGLHTRLVHRHVECGIEEKCRYGKIERQIPANTSLSNASLVWVKKFLDVNNGSTLSFRSGSVQSIVRFLGMFVSRQIQLGLLLAHLIVV